MAETTKTMKTGMFERTLTFERTAVNKEARTVEMSCSSELPVERWFGYEILDHSPQSCDLSRLNNRGALLMDHDTSDQIGVIEKAQVSERKLRATVRFGKSARAEEIFQDVLDGIRGLVSIGYRIAEMVLEKSDDGGETYRATSWMPYEVSLVSVPADPSVGVGRAAENKEQFETVVKDTRNMPNTIPTPAPATVTAATPTNPVIDLNAERSSAANAATKRAKDLFELGRQFNCPAEALSFLNEGKSPEDFRKWILENKFQAQPVNTPTGQGDIGMSRKEAKRWSLVRALNRLANHQPVDGLEKEASDAVAKLCGREAAGFFMPNEVVNGHPEERAMVEAMRTLMGRRDLSATGGGAGGGYTIQTDVLGASLIELLRNQTVCFELGARKLGGLVGNVAIPSQNGGATAYWVGENDQTTKSNLTFGQVGLTPHRLSAVTALGKMLLAQASVDVEGLVREDFARVLAIAIDLAVLAGAGNNGEPTGILNTAGIGSVTFGAAATWAKILDFETQVSNANALLGNLAYVSTPSTRAKLKAAAKIGSTYPVFIWEKGAKAGEGDVNGYRALATKQIPTNRVIFGNWSDIVVGDWLGMDVVVDPYTLADKHQVKVTVNMLADVGIRHVGSFCASTDSGAQ